MDQSRRIVYPQRILLCVTGLSPQVVTETLFALREKDEASLPTQIHLITTANGRNRAVRDLLDENVGKFHQFCREFNLTDKIEFDVNHIHVIRGRYDEELTDIRTPQQNECAADLIMELVRQFCSDEKTQVHVSIAGGRKSMGFLVGYALSIFGREQDKLSHVLTSEPFENLSDFFYPSQMQESLFARDGSPLNPMDANIALAEIPFVKLRSGLTQELLNRRVSFSETVRLAQKSVAPAQRLLFDDRAHKVQCGEHIFALTPVVFLVYRWFAQEHQRGHLPGQPGQDLTLESFLFSAREVVNRNGATYATIEQSLLSDEDWRQYFREKRSKINKKLIQVLGNDRAAPYLIESNKKRLATQYFMQIDPHKVAWGQDLSK